MFYIILEWQLAIINLLSNIDAGLTKDGADAYKFLRYMWQHLQSCSLKYDISPILFWNKEPWCLLILHLYRNDTCKTAYVFKWKCYKGWLWVVYYICSDMFRNLKHTFVESIIIVSLRHYIWLTLMPHLTCVRCIHIMTIYLPKFLYYVGKQIICFNCRFSFLVCSEMFV